MTNADKIRNLSDEELVDLLAWGEVYAEGLKVPSCDEGCESCPYYWVPETEKENEA